jgi:RHS repeat-associated protein
LRQYTQVGAVTPTYDANGNITSGYGGGLTLVYDCENRLTTAGSVSYAYDWLGRRVSRTVSGGTTTCVYDGGQIIAEYNGGSLIRKYIYGPGIDNPVAMIRRTSVDNWYYYYTDALGSVRLLTNASGAVVESYTYDPYGTPRVMYSAGSDGNWLTEDVVTYTSSFLTRGNPIMFTGRWWDSTPKLYHYRARDYSPALGRFLQPDPIGYADSMNLYQYCGNNPINWLDPLGLSTARIWLTDGTKITLIDPTIDEFRNAVASQKNSSIKKIQIAGHGNSENMLIEHGYFGEGLELQNGQVVYTDTRKSFANGVKNKLAKDANIELDGCNTAYKGGWFSNKNNISKQLSNELPGVTVKGNRGVGVGNELFGWNPKGWETHVGGFGRTYKNGHEQ